MKILPCGSFFAFIFLIFSTTNGVAQNKMSARQIVEKNIEAQGGRATLLKVKTLYTEYRVTENGHQLTYIIKQMLPNKGSFEILNQGESTFKSVFDGKSGFFIENGKKSPDSPEAFKDELLKKNIFDEFDYLDTSIYKIELAGEDSVGNEPAYVIRTTHKNGAEKNIYYSKKTFLELKNERTHLAEIDRSTISLVEKNTRVGDIMLESRSRLFVGTDHEQVMELVNYAINQNVSDKDFE